MQFRNAASIMKFNQNDVLGAQLLTIAHCYYQRLQFCQEQSHSNVTRVFEKRVSRSPIIDAGRVLAAVLNPRCFPHLSPGNGLKLGIE